MAYFFQSQTLPAVMGERGRKIYHWMVKFQPRNGKFYEFAKSLKRLDFLLGQRRTDKLLDLNSSLPSRNERETTKGFADEP
mgnify:CR=1 FL=1